MHWNVHCMCTGICTGASAIPNVLFGMAQPPNSGPAIPTGDPTLTSKRRLKKILFGMAQSPSTPGTDLSAPTGVHRSRPKWTVRWGYPRSSVAANHSKGTVACQMDLLPFALGDDSGDGCMHMSLCSFYGTYVLFIYMYKYECDPASCA